VNFVMAPSTANFVQTNVIGRLRATDMDAAAVMGAVNVLMASVDLAVCRNLVLHQCLETLVAAHAHQLKHAAAMVVAQEMALASASDFFSR
jgi:hypothetical protein